MPTTKNMNLLPNNDSITWEELELGAQSIYLPRLILCGLPYHFFNEKLLSIFNHPKLLTMFHIFSSSL